MKLRSLLLSVGLLLFIFGIFHFPKLQRVIFAINLFDSDKIVENFRSMGNRFQTSNLNKSSLVFRYPRGKGIVLPESFSYGGVNWNTQTFLDSSFTTGLIVIQDDSVVFENYYLGNTETTKTISWSLAKSFISSLVGIAVGEGYIRSVMENIDHYVPELKGTAYEGVSIKDVLQMSTGVGFNEDYGDFNSDINRWGRGFAFGRSQDKFPSTLKREREPGTYNHYVSINTHVLGMLLTEATGKSITDYMQEKLWTPAGMEDDAFWIIDGKGMEMALGGLNATLRDYAKIGGIYLNNGYFNNRQIVPAPWVEISTIATEDHLLPGDNPNSAHDLGYGYQWWIPESTEGEFIALGIYNQNIYINQTTKTVIAKSSANPYFNDKSKHTSRTHAHIEMYRAIVDKIESEKSPPIEVGNLMN